MIHHHLATSRWNSNTVSCDSVAVPSSGHGSKTVISIPKWAGCPEQQGQQADQARWTWGWLSEVHRICYLSAQGGGGPGNEGDHERSDSTVVHRVPVSGILCQWLHTTINHHKNNIGFMSSITNRNKQENSYHCWRKSK